MLIQQQISVLKYVLLAILLKAGFAKTLALVLFLLMPLENNVSLYVHLTTMPTLLLDNVGKIVSHTISILLIRRAK